MTDVPYPIAITFAAARKAPMPEGKRSAELMKHGTMRLLYYAPKGVDRSSRISRTSFMWWRAEAARFSAGHSVQALFPAMCYLRPRARCTV